MTFHRGFHFVTCYMKYSQSVILSVACNTFGCNTFGCNTFGCNTFGLNLGIIKPTEGNMPCLTRCLGNEIAPKVKIPFTGQTFAKAVAIFNLQGKCRSTIHDICYLRIVSNRSLKTDVRFVVGASI